MNQNEQEVLDQFKQALAENRISVSEMKAILQKHQADSSHDKDPQMSRLVTVLLWLGGSVIAVGLIVLISNVWDQIPNTGRILSTLGFGLLALYYAITSAALGKVTTLRRIMDLLAAGLIPVGVLVTASVYQLHASYGIQTIVWLLIAGLFLAANLAKTRAIPVIASTVFLTLAFFSATSWLVRTWLGSDIEVDSSDFFWLRSLVLAIVFAATGLWLRYKPALHRLGTIMRNFGAFVGLLALLSLSGWSEPTRLWLDVIFLPLCLGIGYISTKLESRGLLSISCLAVIVFLAKISGVYFVDSLGWPFALIFAGVGIVTAGLVAYKVGQNMQRK